VTPREVSRFAGSSAALVRAATGLLSAGYMPVNVWMPRSRAAWASTWSSSPAGPAPRQPGMTAMATSAAPSCPAGSRAEDLRGPPDREHLGRAGNADAGGGQMLST
jgi:hypothetical protein